MARRYADVIAETEHVRERFRQQRIVAALCRFVTIAHDLAGNRYVCATQDTVVSLGGRQYSRRRAAFEALRRALQLPPAKLAS